MSQSISEILDVNREFKKPFGLKAEKVLHRVTFNPSSANSGEALYVHLPKLSDNMVYVPGSVSLIFNLNLATSGHANNTIVNNISRNLIARMKALFGGEILQDTNRVNLYKTYQDLFLSKMSRENMLREGISSANMHKIRTSAGDKLTTDAKLVALVAIYSNKYRLAINHPIIDQHGVFYARGLTNNLTFEIYLTESKNLVITSDSSKSYEYSLSNIELEYVCMCS